MSQAMLPDRTVPLRLVPNTRGQRPDTRLRKIIDISPFPSKVGAYAIRFEHRVIPRLSGGSQILKIGCSKPPAGFKHRFDQYNHQSGVTTSTTPLFDLLAERSQSANVAVMYYLSQQAGADAVVVDLYYARDDGPDSRAIERALMRRYHEAHFEHPPLNTGNS